MDLSSLAETAAIAFAAAVLLAVLCTLGHAVARVAADRLMASRSQAASDAAVQALRGGGMATAAMALQRLHRRRLLGLLMPFGARVSGANSDAVTALARLTGVEEVGRRWRRSRRAFRRLHGTRVGAQLGAPSDDVARLLGDRSPEVRAAAAKWAGRVPGPDPVTTEGLFALLDDPAPGCSYAAMDALVNLGLSVVPSLAEHLAGSDPVNLVRCLTIATHIADPNLGSPALGLIDHESPQVRAGAATVLGVTGSGLAVDRLLFLTDDSEPIVRAAAAEALGRLHAWTTVAALGELLRDSEWIVRRASVLALNGLDGPGQLVLQRAVGGDDRFASDIARLALGLGPELEGPT